MWLNEAHGNVAMGFFVYLTLISQARSDISGW